MTNIEQQAEACYEDMLKEIIPQGDNKIEQIPLKSDLGKMFCKEIFIAGSKATESAGVWVKATDRLPLKEGIYIVKTATDPDPQSREFIGVQFTNYYGYAVTEWLDISAPPSLSLLQQENERLRGEVESLKRQIEKDYKGYKFK